MVIFTIMSTLVFGGLSSIVKSREATTLELNTLTNMQVAFAIIERDVRQAVNRSSRNIAGEKIPAFMGSNSDDRFLKLIRLRKSNKLQFNNMPLERVYYSVEESTLFRHTWKVIDIAVEGLPIKFAILKNISKVSVAFLNQKLAWKPTWTSEKKLIIGEELPRAVKITLEMENGEMFTRLFAITG